jgi:hypothetical protein
MTCPQKALSKVRNSHRPHRRYKISAALRGIAPDSAISFSIIILLSYLHPPIVSTRLHILCHSKSTSPTQPPEIFSRYGLDQPYPPHPAHTNNKNLRAYHVHLPLEYAKHISTSGSPAASLAKNNLGYRQRIQRPVTPLLPYRS